MTCMSKSSGDWLKTCGQLKALRSKRFRGFCRDLCGIITWGVAVGTDVAALAKACRVKKVMEERFTHA